MKLNRFGLLLMVLSLLVACGEATPTTTPPTTPAGTATGGNSSSVDRSKLSETLRIYAWGEYIPEDVPQLFESEFGVKVTVDTYSSNEEMAAKIRAGNSGYDIVQPSDYMVALLAEGNYLAKINLANIPNVANIDPANMGLYYDPNNEFSVPYLWGTTGIAYDKTAVSPAPTSWSILFDPAQLSAYKGRVSMLNDEREVIGAAMLFLGKDRNSSDPADLEAAKKVLLEQKPLLAKYNSDNVYQDLASGEVVLAQSWNLYTGLAMIENENIEWVIPQEGGVIWQDTMAIVAGSANQYTAEVFIDFMNRPEIAAKVADFTGALTPNIKAEPLIGAELKAVYPKIKPSAEDRKRLDWLRKGQNATAFSDVWSAVKSQ